MSKNDYGLFSYHITVIIVTFNNIDLIAKCLSSLSRALHGYSAQVVIIDNNSTDGTVSYLNSNDLAGKFDFTQLNIILNKKNTGFTYAVNQGLQKSSGDFLLILNPDVIVQSDTLAVLLKLFKNDKIGVVAPQLRYPNGKIQPSCRRFPRKWDVLYEISGLTQLFRKSRVFNNWKMADFTHMESRFVEQPQGAFLLTQKKVLQKVGLFDCRFPMFFSDVDWCYRVLLNNWSIFFCAETFVYHYKGASVYRKHSEMIVSSHRSFVSFFRKYDRNLSDKLYTSLIYLLLLVVTLPRLLFTIVSKKL